MAITTLDFTLASAFTRSPFGGNPAATIFLPVGVYNPKIHDGEWMQSVATTLNQPIATFIFPASHTANNSATQDAEDGIPLVGVRWFTTAREAPLCGHGLLVAAHSLFVGACPPSIIPQTNNLKTIKFKTNDNIVSAKRVRLTIPNSTSDSESEMIQIELPMASVVPASESEFTRVANIVERACHNAAVVKYVGCVTDDARSANFKQYVLVEVEIKPGGDAVETKSLGELDVDTTILRETTPFVVNVITATPKPDQPQVYDTRMFAPLANVPEDHVCGSATCLSAPYWSSRTSLERNKEMFVKQVSKRGGDIWIDVRREEGKVVLKGEVKIIGHGKLEM